MIYKVTSDLFDVWKTCYPEMSKGEFTRTLCCDRFEFNKYLVTPQMCRAKRSKRKLNAMKELAKTHRRVMSSNPRAKKA